MVDITSLHGLFNQQTSGHHPSVVTRTWQRMKPCRRQWLRSHVAIASTAAAWRSGWSRAAWFLMFRSGFTGLRPSRWAKPVNIEKAIENDDFSMENGDFPIESGDFPIENCDLPIKNCDFPIKHGHRKLVDLPSYKMVIYKRVCRVDVTWWTWKKGGWLGDTI